jgi:hypothetical protein
MWLLMVQAGDKMPRGREIECWGKVFYPYTRKKGGAAFAAKAGDNLS